MQFLTLHVRFLIAALLLCLVSPSLAADGKPTMDLGFIQNQGQLRDSKGHARPDLRYMIPTSQGAVYLRTDGVSYVFVQNQGEGDQITQTRVRSDINWIGANPQPQIVAENKLKGALRYFYGNESIETEAFSKVTYKEIYPNIDLVYLTTGEKGIASIKYEFVVHPGGNPAQIQLRYMGFNGVQLTREGNIVSTNALGKVDESAPITFVRSNGGQIPVASQYVLRNGVLTFGLGAYDASQTLVIDPLTRIWATNFGGSAYDRIEGIALDASNNVIVTGSTASTDFPVTPGAISTTISNQSDAFAAQFNTNGGLVWATYYGGSGTDQGLGIAIDASNRINIVGYTTSLNFPVQNSPIRTTAGGGGDGFILQLASNGSRNWATYFGGTSNDYLTGVAVLATGDIAIAGRTFSTGLATSGAQQASKSGNRDAILARVSSAGTLSWATYMGSTQDDQAFAVAVGPNGNLFFTGQTASTGLATSGAFQTALGGGTDAWVASYSAAGSRNWLTYLGGTITDIPQALTTDGTGNVYVTGLTSSTNFPIQSAFQASSGGLTDAFVSAINPTGSGLVMSSFLGGNGTDQAFGLTRIGNFLYVTGASNSNNFNIINPNAVALPFQNQNNGFLDVFLTKINLTTISREWSILYGGSADDVVRSIVSNAAGRIALGGYTNSPNISRLNPLTGQALPSVGNDDGLVLQFTDETQVICVPFAVTVNLNSPLCTGDSNGTIVVTTPLGSNFVYSLAGAVTRAEQAGVIFNNLPGGTYAVTARNTAATNCTATAANQILTNPGVVNVTATPVSFDCGSSNGQIQVSATGGTGAFEFSLTGPNNNPLVDFSALSSFGNLNLAGTYTIMARDANGCSSSTTALLTQNPTFIVTAIASPTTCGLQNGNISVNAPIVGAVGTVSYQVETLTGTVVRTSINPLFLGLASGTYIIRATDSRPCSAFTDPLVVGGSSNTLQVSSVQPGVISCNGTTTSLSVVLNGGLAPYSFTLIAGNGPILSGAGIPIFAFSIPNVPAGPFSLSVTDANGCSAIGSTTGTISQPSLLTALVSSQNANCATNQQATISVVPNGGVSPYSVILNGANQGSQTIFTALAAGDYDIIVRDANNCSTAVQTLTIAPSNAPSFQTVLGNPPSCTGLSDGSIDIVVSSGTPNFTYFINNTPATPNPIPDPTFTYESLAAGVYAISLIDDNGCLATRDVTLVDAAPIVINDVVATAPSVCGNIDGALTINASGGTGALSYQYQEGLFVSPFQPSNAIAPIPAGFYTLVVEDANGCQTKTTKALNDNGSPEILNVQPFNPLCANDPTRSNTGQILIFTSSPVNPSFYSISGLTGPFESSGNGSFTFPNLTAGTYDVVASTTDDLLGCKSFFGPAKLVAPAPIVVINAVILKQPSCGPNSTGGEIQLTASGGTGNLVYGVVGGGLSPSNIVGGLYPHPGGIPLEIRDQLGCTVSGGTYFLFNSSGLTLPAPIVNGTTCGGGMGSITVVPFGGSFPRSYFLNGELKITSTSTFYVFNNLTGGVYDIEIRDASGCRVQTRVTLSDLQVESVSTVTPACGTSNGSITIDVSGDGPFSYTFEARVYNPANLALGPIEITGGANNQTSPFTLPNLAAGVYDLRITDESNPATCTLERTVRLFNVGGPNVVATLSNNRNCNLINGSGTSGSVTIYTNGLVQQVGAASPLAQFSRQIAVGPSTTFTTIDDAPNFLPAGTYDLFAIGTNGCITDGGTETVTQPVFIKINDVKITQPVCLNGINTPGQIQVTAVGGTVREYSIDNGATWQLSNVFADVTASPTPYTVRVREAGIAGCGFIWANPVVITNTSGLNITSATITNPTCFEGTNGRIDLVISGGLSPYQIFVNGVLFASTTITTYRVSALNADNYFVRVVDASGCSDEALVTIADPSPIQVQDVVTGALPTVCRGGSITGMTVIGGTAPFNVRLYEGPNVALIGNVLAAPATAFTDLSIGVYRIVATDANGCTGDIFYEMLGTGFTRLSIGRLTATDATCFGGTGSITFNVAAPANDLIGGLVTYTIDGTVPTAVSPVVGPTGEVVIPNLNPGLYNLRVLNSGSTCQTRANVFTVRVNQPNPVFINKVDVTQPNCNTTTTGTIRVTAFGGTQQLEYSIDGGNTWQRSNLFTNLSPTNPNFVPPPAPQPGHQVSVRAVGSTCPPVNWTSTIIISNPTNTFIVYNGQFGTDFLDASCSSVNDGFIRVNVNTNASLLPSPFPLQLYLNGNLNKTLTNQVNQTVTFLRDLSPGTYQIRIRDSRGCEDVQSVTVGTREAYTVSTALRQPTTCGGTNGRITVTVDGGQGNREIVLLRNGVPFRTRTSLAPTQDVIVFGNLLAANYQIIRRYEQPFANACAETLSVALFDPGSPSITQVKTTAATNAVCSNGSAEVLTIGGAINPQYRITRLDNTVLFPYQSARLFPALPSGTYVVELRTGVIAPFCFTYQVFTVGCTSTTREVALKSSETSLEALSVYPNPNSGQFSIRFSSSRTDIPVQIEVMDLTGKTLYSLVQHAQYGSNEFPIQLETVASGLYLVHIQQGDFRQTVKIVVE